MKIVTLLIVAAMTSAFAGGAAAQEQPAPGAQPDQVDQLAEMLDLSDGQQDEIRSVIAEMSPQIEELQGEAQALQQELQQHAGPDFDEGEIRERAGRLGEVTGEMTALSLILQSRVESVFTEDQRAQLERQVQQQQEQQRQMQEQLRRQQQQQQPAPAP